MVDGIVDRRRRRSDEQFNPFAANEDQQYLQQRRVRLITGILETQRNIESGI